VIWVLVFGLIALGGLVMVICFGISLWRKSQSLLIEVGMLLERADQVVGLLDQIEGPSNSRAPLRFQREHDDGEHENEDAEMGFTRQPAT
jgi:hypothetical protein